MAFAADCIEAWLIATGTATDFALLGLGLMREFCTHEDLGDWEFDLLNTFPTCVAAVVVQETGSEALGHAIEAALEDIGRANLYSGVVGRSEETLQGAVTVAALALAAGIDTPDPKTYLTSPFSEVHGWGHAWASRD